MHSYRDIASVRRNRARHALAAVLVLATSACAAATMGSAPAPARAEPVSPELAVLTFDSAWSRIAHTHYDTAYGGVDWNAVKQELRPRAEAATTLAELRSVISAMLARLADSHYGLIPREASAAVSGPAAAGTPTGDAGLEVRLVAHQVLVWRVDPDGPAAAAGIRTGWELIAIDGTPLQARLDALNGLPSAQQRTARTRFLYQVNALLKGEKGAAVSVRVIGAAGRAANYEIVRREHPGDVHVVGNLPPLIAELRHERLQTATGCVGLIRLSAWVPALVAEFDGAIDTMRDCVGVIIDLRGNPGGVAGTVMGIAGHFLNDTLPLGFMRARINGTRVTELRFKANPRRVSPDGRRIEPYAGPLAILTDEMSASTSEFFAAGLQGVGRARVFGGNSAGQALPAAVIRLPTDDMLMHVFADFTGPGGVRIEGRGVQPDVLVPDTREDLLAGRDAPLRAALAWISGATRAGSQPMGGILE